MAEHLTDNEGLLPVAESAEQFSRGYAPHQPIGEITDNDIPEPDAPTPWDELPDDIKNRITWATRYHEAGFPVILLQPGRKDPPKGKPVIPFHDVASLQRALARPVDDHYPNYGVRGGPGHVWIDLDNGTKNGVKRHGEKNFRALANEHGGLPRTFAAKTPSKGGHLLFKVPEPVGNANSLPDHVDTRGINGYVVGVGCEIIKGLCDPDDTPGCYEHVSGSLDNIPDAPAWLFDSLTTARAEVANLEPLVPWDLPESVEAARDFILNREPAVQGDHGDDWTFQTFAWLCDFGVSLEKAIELVLEPREETNGESWNSRCAPPWEVEGSNSLRTKALSAYSPSHQNRPGVKSPAFKARQYEQASGLNGDASRGGTGNGSPDAPSDDIPGDDGATDPEAHIYSLDGFLKSVQPREFAIDRWLPAKGVSYILAKRGTGKSAILTDLACRIASDNDWHGVQVDKTRIVAVYLCGEDDDGLALNLRAWQEEHGIEIDPSRLIVSNTVMQLKNRAEVEAWAKALKSRVGDRRAIVIMDTWQRATSSAKSQSEESDISAAFANAEYLLDVLDAPGLFAAHPPKAVKHEDDLSVMGTSIAENQAVAIWTLWDTDTDPNPEADHNLGLRLRVAKVRGARKGAYHLMRLREVALKGRKNNFGRDYEGVVVDHVGGVADLNDAEAKRQEWEREEGVRAAYAEMVRHLFRWRETKECLDMYGDKGFNLTQNGFAEEAARQMKTVGSYLQVNWAATAEDAGLVAFGVRTIRNALAKHFRPGLNRPSTYDYDDGTRLTVTRKGKTARAQCYYDLGVNLLTAAAKTRTGM